MLALTLSSAASSSAESWISVAARLSSSFAINLAPIMTLLTGFWCNSQASAMRATETPRALAIG